MDTAMILSELDQQFSSLPETKVQLRLQKVPETA